jgi:hypothetical protein
MVTKIPEPALHTEKFIETDSKTGLRVPVTLYRRGVLCTHTRHYTISNFRAATSFNPEERLRELCDHLRGFIEENGWPSDRTPCWVCENGQWRPRKEGDSTELRYQAWIKRVEELAGPLSQGHCAADLLLHLNVLLGRKRIGPHLWHICQVMELYFLYRSAGEINGLAASGRASIKGREAGPAARKLRGRQIRGVICQLASEFWSQHPLYRDDASNTAAQIVDSVHEELVRHQLIRPTGKRLSVKTISDHIRNGDCGKKNHTG